MTSNLPPGVTPDMIPGNRPEDRAWEYAHEQIDAWCEQQRLSPEDFAGLWKYVTAHIAPLWVARLRLRLAVDGAEDSLERVASSTVNPVTLMANAIATKRELQQAQNNDEGVA